MTTINKTNPLFIKLDSSRCQGHNRCYLIAPELFDVDDFGQSRLRSTGPVPPELIEKATLAMQNCPEFAIDLVEANAGDAHE